MATFLVVEIPGMKSPGVEFSRSHPGVCLDFVLETPLGVPDGSGPMHILCHGSGSPPADVEAFRKALSAAYPTMRWKRILDQPAMWRGSFDVPMGPLDPVSREVTRFTDAQNLRVRWGRLEEGVVFLLALVDDRARAQGLAERLRGALEALDLDADVAVEEESDEHLSKWLQVVKQSADQKEIRP